MADEVERPVAGDGRRPPAEAGSVAAEATQIPRDLRPRLRRDVLGLVADDAPQVTQQAGLHGAVDGAERLFVAALCPVDQHGEVVGVGGVAGVLHRLRLAF